MSTKASQHDPQDRLPGIDFANTVITEIDCGPRHIPEEKGMISKARELAGRLSRVSSYHHHHTGSAHFRSQHSRSGEEIEMHCAGDGNEIVVSYDVWRTVEEKSDANAVNIDSLATK